MNHSKVDTLTDVVLAYLGLLAGASVLSGMAFRAVTGSEFGAALEPWQWKVLSYGTFVLIATWAWWGSYGTPVRRLLGGAKKGGAAQSSHAEPARPTQESESGR